MSRQVSISVCEQDNGQSLRFQHEEDIVSDASTRNYARLYFTYAEDHLGIETSNRIEIEKLLGRRFRKDELIAWIGHIGIAPGYEQAGVMEAFLDAMTREAIDGGSSILVGSPEPRAVSMEYQDKYQQEYIKFLVANGFTHVGHNNYVKILKKPASQNPFLAQPTKHYGPAMSGVVTYPGFHTGSSMSICQPYAQAKVDEFVPDSWGKELKTHVMRDYPVIVELDMQGLPFTIDFDAAQWFNDAVQAAIAESEDFDALESYLDCSDTELETPSSMIEALFYLSGAQPERAVHSLRVWLREQEDPDVSFLKIKNEGLPDDLLAQVSGQFRYTQDVPTGRIIAVHYIRPVFNYLFPHYEDPDWHHDKIIERIEAAGYDTVTLENVYDGREVLTVVKSFDVSPKLFPVENQRIEFHGTSWRNLLSAAPQLADVLPLPPRPFWKYDLEEEKTGDPGNA